MKEMRLSASELFGNNMVLQHSADILIWGHAEPDTKVCITIQGKRAEVLADEKGNWRTSLPPLRASRSERLTISSRNEKLVYENVAVGEVWLAGGQSNMEFFMRYDKDFSEEVVVCDNPDIRFFGYPVITNERAAKMRDYSAFGFWRVCNEENLQYYNAVAYYFAKNLYAELNMPIGIIGCNCGGTRACCWMDERSVEAYGPAWLEDYYSGLKLIQDPDREENEYLNNPFTDKSNPFGNQIADRLMYGVSKDELLAAFQNIPENGVVIGPWHEWRPSGLYHQMVEHIAPYSVKGVLWYQGESDEDHPNLYASMLEGLVSCWRSLWNRQLPFIMAELAPFGTVIGQGGKYYPQLREQQALAESKLEDVWLVSSGDVGSEYDIHPKEKQPIGRRMALSALGHVYGKNIQCEPPVPESGIILEDTIIISFAHAEGGLMLRGNGVNAVRVFRQDSADGISEILGCPIRIRENELLIDLPARLHSQHVIVEFAKTPYYEVNVFNLAGFPLRPFRMILDQNNKGDQKA